MTDGHQFNPARLLNKVSFGRIFLLWLLIIIGFGVLYHGLGVFSYTDFLTTDRGIRVTAYADDIYYSFVTATSTGFGDIIPHGKMIRIISVGEVIFSLLMLAFVTSKLVSLKQDRLIEELYNLSTSEHANRLVSALPALNEKPCDECFLEYNETLKKLYLMISSDHFLFLTFHTESLLRAMGRIHAKAQGYLLTQDAKSVETLNDIYISANISQKMLVKIAVACPDQRQNAYHLMQIINASKEQLFNTKVECESDAVGIATPEPASE